MNLPYQNTIEMNELSDEISLKDLIFKFKRVSHYLTSKWVPISVFFVLGAILGFCYSIYKKPIYTAETTFVLEEGSSNRSGLLGQYSSLASIAGFDLNSNGGGIFQGDNLIELYKSRLMLQKALASKVLINSRQHLLVDKYTEINHWNENPKLKDVNFNLKAGQQYNRFQDSLLSIIVNDINKKYLSITKPDKKLSIIQVEIKAKDEIFAALLDSTIVKTVNDFYVQTKSAKSFQNLQILQHQTDSVRSVLNGAIYKSAASVDATPNLNPTKQVLRVPGQQYLINVEANKAILSQLIQNLELAKISLRKETPLIQVIDTPILPLNVIKIGKIKAAIIGGFLFCFLCMFYLIVRKSYKSIVS